jgi:uncharacterized protein (TIGR02246 family)
MRKNWQLFRWAGLLTVVAVSGALSSFARASQPAGSADATGSESEAQVRTLMAQLTDAYNRSDASGVSTRFTADGDMITGAGEHLASPAEIDKFLSGLMEKLPKGTRFLATVTNVRFAGPDVAVVTSEGGWLYPDQTAISDKNQGLQSVVAIRREGDWRIVLFQRTRKDPTLNAPPAPK